MSFDLFGKTQKRDIRVGYISTDRGYVRGITILEANKYAFKNPGTVFILQTRDSTRYLNINEVNNLTPEDVLPSNTSGEGTCNGIVGLSPKIIDTPTGPLVPPGGSSNNGDPRSFLPRGPVNPTNPSGPGDGTPTSPSTGSQPEGSKNPEQQKVGDGSPIVVISGCGGVGAKAIPVIGNDGGILDIKLIHGGFGYKCPPQVTVIDPNRRGSGVVASSEIGVSTSPTLLTYTEEDDFEMPYASTDFRLLNEEYNLLQFLNGRSFLSKAATNGRIFVFASPFQTDRTNFVNHALFVPVFYRLALGSQRSFANLYYPTDAENISFPLRESNGPLIYQ